MLDIEHIAILERNEGLLPAHLDWYAGEKSINIEDIFRKIIAPLRDYHGIEALQGIVEDTGLQLRGGLLRNPLEIEVTLLAGARVRAATNIDI